MKVPISARPGSIVPTSQRTAELAVLNLPAAAKRDGKSDPTLVVRTMFPSITTDLFDSLKNLTTFVLTTVVVAPDS